MTQSGGNLHGDAPQQFGQARVLPGLDMFGRTEQRQAGDDPAAMIEDRRGNRRNAGNKIAVDHRKTVAPGLRHLPRTLSHAPLLHDQPLRIPSGR